MRLVLVVLMAGALAAAAAAAGPRVAHTAAGNAAARSTLLTASDLGQGWTASKPIAGRLTLTCSGWQPQAPGVVETGGAGLPSLSAGATGPIISQSTSVYATAAEAARLWRQAVKPGLLTCVRASLEAVTTRGIKVRILSQGPLAVAKAGALTAGYRIVADLISPTQTLKTYFDVVLVGRGASLSELTFSSFLAPVPPAVEHALALLVVHEMGIPVA